MAIEYERLAVLLEARVADFERKIAGATRNADRNFKKIEKSAEGMRDKMGKAFSTAGTLAKASIGGLLAGVVGAGAAGIIGQLSEITKGVAEIGDAAKMAGVSAKAFQEWRYVAEQARIPIDSITDGLKEMAIRADEFAVTGKGSAAEAFARLGLTPQEVKERLKDPSELLLILIDRTRKLNDVQAGVRIFDELFGGQGGERMVSLIEQGEAGIRDQIKAANEFGRVLSDDVIQRAAEIDRQFNTIAGTVGTTLKSAIVSVVGSMIDFMDGLRSVENQRDKTVQSSINDIMAQKQAVAKSLAEIDAADSKMSDRQKARAKGTHEITMRQLNERENALIKELESRPSVMNFTPKSSDAWVAPTKYTPPEADGAASARAKAAKDAERERQAVKDLIADLQLEFDMVGKTEVQKAKMNALRQAGAAATAEEQLAIVQKIDAIHREANAYEDAQAAIEEARDAGREFAGTLVDGMLNGATAVETLSSALKGLASRLLNSGLDSLFGMGGGDSGGLLSSVFGGGSKFPSAPGGLFSEGGYTGDGGKYQPAGVVHKGEYVFDKAAVAAAGGPAAMEAMRRGLKGYANGGAVGVSVPSLPSMRPANNNAAPVINYAPVIDNRGASVEAVARLERVMQKQNNELQGRIEAGVRSAQKRNVKLG